MSEAQRKALALAASDSIRYYLGGFYTTASEWQKREQPERVIADGEMIYVSIGTLRSLEATGALVVSKGTSIYDWRWTVTPAGRAALKETTHGT